uniref:Multidrug-efflux transporter n=1 Tax=Candidatus Kentrum sp. FW TaxID=2126338 RepID=A0A450SIR7_9GAMM|nr:MAG: multidrug resistance protein, MATE family [Candidatus Kentron sp. FW]
MKLTSSTLSKGPEASELRAILKIALPFALANVGGIALGLTDSIMLGRVGPELLGATGLAFSVALIIFTISAGLFFPVMVLVSQARGAGRSRIVPIIIRQGLWIAGILSIPSYAILSNLEEILLAAGQVPELARMAGHYMDYYLWAILLSFFWAAFVNAFVAMGWTGTLAVVTWFGVGANVVLDYALIFGKFGAPTMGIAGAGLASVITYIVCFALLFAFIAFHLPLDGRMVFHRLWKPNPTMLARIARLGWPKTLELLMKNGLFSVAALLAGWFGTQVVAAHTIAFQIVTLISTVVSTALAHAVTTCIGMTKGRKDHTPMWRVLNSGLLLFFSFVLPFVVVLGAFPEWAVMLFVGTGPKAESLLPVATPLIVLVAFFMLADGLRMIAGQALNGLSDMKAPALIAAVCYWGIGLPCGAVLGVAMELGVLGLWVGLTVGMGITAAVYLGRFRWVVSR